MKKYKKQVILTSIIMMIPMVVGIMLWDRLPDVMATHFGTNNIPNGWSSKAFTVFGLPLMLLAVHLITILVTLNDPKKQNIGKKMLGFLFWIVPVVSLIVTGATYGYALGMAVDIGMICNVLVGVLFVVIGNYMSKNRQNYTVGIKLPWTLSSQENWNRTHRLASKLWIAAGLIFIVNGFLEYSGMILILIGIMVVIPMAYSFALYKKGI